MEYFLNFDKMTYVKGGRPSGCILCLIRDKSADVVDLSFFESKNFIAAVNLYPYNPGHVMIFPHRHLLDIREYSDIEERELNVVLRLVLDTLDRTHSPRGYNIGYNMSPPAGASIDHIHLHVIPRYPHETGIADLIAGKRVLVESPFVTADRLKAAVRSRASDAPQ